MKVLMDYGLEVLYTCEGWEVFWKPKEFGKFKSEGLLVDFPEPA